MNPRQNTADNNNSILYITSPTIEYLLPNSTSGVVNQQYPVISAYVFPSLSSPVDTNSIEIWIDSTVYPVPPADYNHATKLVSFKPPAPLENGSRTIKLAVKHFGASPVSDSSTFTVLAGAIQILNQSGYTTVKDSFVVNGSVEDIGIHSAQIVINNTDSQTVSITAGKFSRNFGLSDGINTFRAVTKDSTGTTIVSASYVITRFVNHAPTAVISFVNGGSSVTLSSMNSSDPDSLLTASLTYSWSLDPNNPETISGVNGATAKTIPKSTPKTVGEYYFGLIATDSEWEQRYDQIIFHREQRWLGNDSGGKLKPPMGKNGTYL